MQHSTMGWFALAMLFLPMISTGQKKYFRDDLVNMVVEIADKQPERSVGLETGIIINDSARYYLVTATHVIAPIKGQYIVRFKAIGKDASINVPLSMLTRNTFPNGIIISTAMFLISKSSTQ